MKRLVLALAAALAGCAEAPREVASYPAYQDAPLPEAGPPLDPETAARNFSSVVARMEVAIEQECLYRAPDIDCDFQIVVDDRPDQPPNAYQTSDSRGRPIIAFTVPLIADARNTDELAFVMGHEAAHHIAGHIPRQQRSATAGALILGTLTAAYGGDPMMIQTAQDIGATVGARTYSKEFELEADALGTVLAWSAGYDPLRGAAFFARLGDPGDSFLGTHPPNSERIEVVRATLASLR